MLVDPTKVKVVAFDVFGTIFDLSAAAPAEIKAYAHHIRQPWAPLTLPNCWNFLPAHSDSKEGIDRLREKYFVCTCSNGPLGMLSRLSKHNNIQWDCIIPLELNKVFKPNPKAYLTVCDVLGVKPENVLMVTANKTFGDLEGSRAVGMQSALIREELSLSGLADVLCL